MAECSQVIHESANMENPLKENDEDSRIYGNLYTHCVNRENLAEICEHTQYSHKCKNVFPTYR